MNLDAWNEAVAEARRLEEGFAYGSMSQAELVPPLSKVLKRFSHILRATHITLGLLPEKPISLDLIQQAESLSEQLFAVRDHTLKWVVIEESFRVIAQMRCEVFIHQRFPRSVGGEGVTHPTETSSPAGLDSSPVSPPFGA